MNLTPEQIITMARQHGFFGATRPEDEAEALVTLVGAILATTKSEGVAAPNSELAFNAQRLRNVAVLVGLGSAIPENDATLDGARGSVLGMIAGKLRAGVAAPKPLDTFCRWPMCESKEVQEQAGRDAAESMFGVAAPVAGRKTTA